MSPGDLVKVPGFGGQVVVEDAGFSGRRRGGAVGVRPVVRPLRVAQEIGFQCGVQWEEGLDQRGLRLWVEGREERIRHRLHLKNITGLCDYKESGRKKKINVEE